MYGSPASFVDFHVDVLQHGRVDIAIHRMLHDNLVHEQRVEIREAKDRREIFALYFLVVLFACSVHVISLGLYWLQQSRKAKSRRDHRMRRSLHEVWEPRLRDRTETTRGIIFACEVVDSEGLDGRAPFIRIRIRGQSFLLHQVSELVVVDSVADRGGRVSGI